MKTSSAKAKGRRLQNWACEKISWLIGLPWGADEPIAPREMGQNGVDVRLVGTARQKFPFSVECKNCESWSVPAWVKQAKENQMKGTDWLLIVSKNRHSPVVIMDAERFFEILKNLRDRKGGENVRED